MKQFKPFHILSCSINTISRFFCAKRSN